MNSTNHNEKNLSANVGTQSENADAHDHTRQPSSPDWDFHRDTTPGDDATAHFTLVTRLAGLLYALVQSLEETETSERVSGSTLDREQVAPDTYPDLVIEEAADDAVRDAHHVSTWRKPTSETGVRTVSDGEIYGITTEGQPMVASRQMEMTAKTNTSGRPADTLLEPTESLSEEMLTVEDAGPNELIDPLGDRIAGIASGFDEHASQFTADTRATEVTDTNAGVATADLEVQLPDGTLQPLREVVDDPERFTRSSLETIEATLALEAELSKVSDGIREDGELVGYAKELNEQFDQLADARPKAPQVAKAREQKHREAYLEYIQPLEALNSETNAEVRAAARRLQEEFDDVHELRKTPLALAIEMAERVSRGADPTTALLSQAKLEKTDPRNVLQIGNVRYASTKQTQGRVSTQGTVKRLFETEHPNLKQAGILQDETGEIRFGIFHGSEIEEVMPTADPNDTTGVTVVREHRFPQLREGDTVRFENVFKGWWNGEPKLETRRDSHVKTLARDSDSVRTADRERSRLTEDVS